MIVSLKMLLPCMYIYAQDGPTATARLSACVTTVASSCTYNNYPTILIFGKGTSMFKLDTYVLYSLLQYHLQCFH